MISCELNDFININLINQSYRVGYYSQFKQHSDTITRI